MKFKLASQKSRFIHLSSEKLSYVRINWIRRRRYQVKQKKERIGYEAPFPTESGIRRIQYKPHAGLGKDTETAR